LSSEVEEEVEKVEVEEDGGCINVTYKYFVLLSPPSFLLLYRNVNLT
jgi:hypothetical protein